MAKRDRANLVKAQPIRDARYEGKDDFQLFGERLISANVSWTPPIYNPFSLDELVCVHITDQEAKEGFLKPHSYHPHNYDGRKWLFPRETLHFTLNGPVADHNGGDIFSRGYSWQGKEFAYLIPLQDIIPQVVSLFTHDTIALGKIRLPNSTMVVAKQSGERIIEKLRKAGYRPFQMRGCLQLDPAILDKRGMNVNHVANFQSIIDNYRIDGPYTSASINNILYLDGFLTAVYDVASKGSYVDCLEKPATAKDIAGRMDYLKKRWGDDPNKSGAISRLDTALQRYMAFLRDWNKVRRERFSLDSNLSSKAYTAKNERVIAQEELLKKQILWEDTPGK